MQPQSVRCSAARSQQNLPVGNHLPAGTFYGTFRRNRDRESSTEDSADLFRSPAGTEPVREWLKRLDEVEGHAIGRDLLRAQWRWPTGMPLCRPMGAGLWEIRTDLPTKRTARVLICLYNGHLIALHAFIKKTRTAPPEDLELARKRQKEVEYE